MSVADAGSQFCLELCEGLHGESVTLPAPAGGANQLRSAAVGIGHVFQESLPFQPSYKFVDRLAAYSETAGQINAPFDQVMSDLADPANHPEWGAEFFSGPARPGFEGEVMATVPRMGGDVHMKIESDLTSGRIDLYMAPLDAPFGPPLPVRVVPNGEGVDVLFTLTRFPGQSDTEWVQGLESMGRELENLKARHER